MTLVRGEALVLLALAAVTAAGCRRAPDGGSGALALDGEELARHVRYETGLTPGDLDPQGLVRLRAELVAEALMARGAERAKLAPREGSVAREAAELKRRLGTSAPADAVLEGDARRRVLARAYEEQVVVPAASAAPAANQDAVPPPSPSPDPGEADFVFRQVRTDAAEEARRVARRIERGEAFEDVAREVSTSPDRGRPLRRSPAELPEAVAAALAALREGETAGPVEVDGAYYVFALEGKAAAMAPRPDPEELRLQARRRTYHEVRARHIADLARQEGVPNPLAAEPAEGRPK